MTTKENLQEAVIVGFRPYFRYLEALGLQTNNESRFEEIRMGLLARVLELVAENKVTSDGEEFEKIIEDTWSEIPIDSDELIYELHSDPTLIFPKEDLPTSGEENLRILEEYCKEERIDAYETVVEETVVEEAVVEETVVEEAVVEETVVEETVVEDPMDELNLVADNLMTGSQLLDWPWYLELIAMAENSEGLIGLPNVLVKLHNQKLITTKRNMLDTILMALHSDIGTDGVRQISSLFDKLE